MIQTYLQREDIKINLREALDWKDFILQEEDLDWLLDHNTPDSDIARWSVRDYMYFASSVASEDDNIKYVAREYGFAVDEEEDEE